MRGLGEMMRNAQTGRSTADRPLTSATLPVVGAGERRPVRLVLADDHAVMRQSLRILLGLQPFVEVVADVEDGRAAVQAVAELRPDVVIMDLAMPTLNGADATLQIRRVAPGSRVIILSAFAEEENVLTAVRAGAAGYVLKKADADELLLAIQAVHHGNRYFSSELAEEMDMGRILIKARDEVGYPGVEPLTLREREILQLVAEGYSNQALARVLCISVKTVESHKGHIRAKLQARTGTDLIRCAVQMGLVQLNAAGDRTTRRGAGLAS